MKFKKSSKMSGSLDKIDSVAALSPTMQLAKDTAKDKYETFDKIVLSEDDTFLGAKNQPTPKPPTFELDESMFKEIKSKK